MQNLRKYSLWELWALISPVMEGANFSGGERIGQCNITYEMHVALERECSIPAAEWLDSSAVATVQLVADLQSEWEHSLPWVVAMQLFQITLGGLVCFMVMKPIVIQCAICFHYSCDFWVVFSSMECIKVWIWDRRPCIWETVALKLNAIFGLPIFPLWKPVIMLLTATWLTAELLHCLLAEAVSQL